MSMTMKQFNHLYAKKNRAKYQRGSSTLENGENGCASYADHDAINDDLNLYGYDRQR